MDRKLGHKESKKEIDAKLLKCVHGAIWIISSGRKHITKEYVLGQVNIVFKRKLLKERIQRWLGQILRGESHVKEVFEGRMEGKTGRGKQRIIMLDDIKANQTNKKIKRRAMDREC